MKKIVLIVLAVALGLAVGSFLYVQRTSDQA